MWTTLLVSLVFQCEGPCDYVASVKKSLALQKPTVYSLCSGVPPFGGSESECVRAAFIE